MTDVFHPVVLPMRLSSKRVTYLGDVLSKAVGDGAFVLDTVRTVVARSLRVGTPL